MEQNKVWEKIPEIAFVKAAYKQRQQSFVLAEMIEKPKAKEVQVLQGMAEYVLSFWECNGEIQLSFYSQKDCLRAIDLMDCLVENMGSGKGDAAEAQGRIPVALLQAHMTHMDQKDYREYFFQQVQAFISEERCINAKQYAITHREEIVQYPRYQKKKVSWAYVKTEDIAVSGTQLMVKSLENKSGIQVTAGEDTYIMIGRRGEVYHISKDKFLSTYEESLEPLDIFEQMLEFIPVVETVEQGNYISIDGLAKLCYPKNQTKIYCRQLQQYTRVFAKNSGREYFFGRPGDYLAVCSEDFTDMYIIQEEIFQETYEKETEGSKVC